MKSQLSTTLFFLLVCQAIFSLNQVQADCVSGQAGCSACTTDVAKVCSTCSANYYLNAGSCTSCGTGKYSAAASKASTDCKTCADTNCKSCSGAGTQTCSACNTGYNLGSSNTCFTCYDSKCATCTSARIGLCSGCQVGYNLVSGTCQLPTNAATPVNNRTGAVEATIRYDMTLAQFLAAGGESYFIASISQLLSIFPTQVEVTEVLQGSVIIKFKIYTIDSSTVTLAQLKALLDLAVQNGSMNLFDGARILEYSSAVVFTVTCAGTQYLDINAGACKDCPSDCPDCTSADDCKKKKNLGAILGGVFGGLALVGVLAGVYIKRDSIKSLLSRSPRSAKYSFVPSRPGSPARAAR